MATISVLKYVIVFYLQLVLYSSSKLSRLERRVDLLEQKMVFDVMSLKADIADIFEKLDNILENSSHIGNEIRHTVSSKLDETEAENVLILVKKAFYEEKRYTRKVIKELRNELLRKIELLMTPEKVNEMLFDQFLSLDLRINSTLLKVLNNKEAINGIVVNHNETLSDLQYNIEEVDMKLNEFKDFEQNIKTLETTNDYLSARIDCHSKSWQSFGQSCYHVGNRNPQTWKQAKEKCKLLNSSLAEVESKEENSFLVELAAKMTSESELYGVYLGGSDLAKEGEWLWVGSQRKIFDVFNNFKGYQPDGRRRENCLHLIRKYSWNWNDIPCDTRLSYICEKKFY